MLIWCSRNILLLSVWMGNARSLWIIQCNPDLWLNKVLTKEWTWNISCTLAKTKSVLSKTLLKHLHYWNLEWCIYCAHSD